MKWWSYFQIIHSGTENSKHYMFDTLTIRLTFIQISYDVGNPSLTYKTFNFDSDFCVLNSVMTAVSFFSSLPLSIVIQHSHLFPSNLLFSAFHKIYFNVLLKIQRYWTWIQKFTTKHNTVYYVCVWLPETLLFSNEIWYTNSFLYMT
jgi:hypothetical protein